MLQPLFVTDLLAGLGFGQRVLLISGSVMFVLYLMKGRRAAGMFADVMGTLWLAAVSIGLAFTAALILGWVTPEVQNFAQDAVTAGEMLYDLVQGTVGDYIRSLLDRAV